MVKYNPQKIEKKWQRFWEINKIYQTKSFSKKPKFYVLDMFPYPSGAGLHVGHPKGYIATDVIARMKMMQGYNVLHPMGWDAFGLPAENYALKNKIHPRVAVERNIKKFKKQIKKIGFTYDWSHEINTTDPDYYKWTQWIFLQMYKKGLAYLSEEPVNWCPKCQTVLANEDLEQGHCERCGALVERRRMKQWVLKMTAYAERLLKDLKLLDWEESIIEQQKNWIGRSEGAIIKFQILNSKPQTNSEQYLEIFTTRLDTIFGCTYVVIAPEHQILKDSDLVIKNQIEVKKYIEKTKHKSDLERTDLAKEKTGVELKGLKAINPFTDTAVPVFVADYVLPYYGTGAIMAVPAHDERDFEFAQKYNLPIKQVIKGNKKLESKIKIPFTEDGILINSGQFSGLTSQEARKRMIDYAQRHRFGRKAVFYKMHDWVFSRQRYWGEPFPIVYCRNCWEKYKYKNKLELNRDYTFIDGEEYMIIPVPEKDLPVELPKVKHYEPTGTGESPLANIKNWVWTKCPKCGAKAKRETNTMPQWAGSCWYYLRYIDPQNNKKLIAKSKEKYWMPVDLYVGGAEHATRHLLYARFWHKFLYDIGVVSTKEPFKRLQHVGLILAEDGRKMSKRWGNVINPDDVVKEYGADALRLYEMFMGPFDQSVAWQTNGLIGMRRFLERVWKLGLEVKIQKPKRDIQNRKLEKLVHQTIEKVTQDINGFKFNTAISALMILANELEKSKQFPKDFFEIFLKLLSPFAPHLTEELWSWLGHSRSIFQSDWPQAKKFLLKEDVAFLVIQVNGRVRDRIEVPSGISEKEVQKLALARPKIQKWLAGKEAKKIIYIPNKLINIVI